MPEDTDYDLNSLPPPEKVGNRFQTELREFVNKFRREAGLSYAECVGILHIMAQEVATELFEEERE
jgi:hypothetical protein